MSGKGSSGSFISGITNSSFSLKIRSSTESVRTNFCAHAQNESLNSAIESLTFYLSPIYFQTKHNTFFIPYKFVAAPKFSLLIAIGIFVPL